MKMEGLEHSRAGLLLLFNTLQEVGSISPVHCSHERLISSLIAIRLAVWLPDDKNTWLGLYLSRPHKHGAELLADADRHPLAGALSSLAWVEKKARVR